MERDNINPAHKDIKKFDPKFDLTKEEIIELVKKIYEENKSIDEIKHNDIRPYQPIRL